MIGTYQAVILTCGRRLHTASTLSGTGWDPEGKGSGGKVFKYV